MNIQAKDERIRQQIREAARGLFQKWGLIKTTMEDIAKAAQKGKSTLYYYFKSKDEIFEEIASEEFHAIVIAAQAAMEKQTSAEGKLRAYLLCMIEEIQKRATVYEVVFGEISKVESIASTLRKKQDEHELEVISKILVDGVRSGELKLLNDQDIHRMSSIILLSFKTLVLEYAMKNALDELIETVDFGIKVFMRGLQN
jgi:AcrR family transcriptional regulator